MRSTPLRIVAAVILFFLLLLAGWVNTIPICLRAVSSASAEAFGSIGAFASRARPAPGAPATPWTCSRMLNSSGQDCWTAGSALTHEMWSSPSAFIRAVRPTGNIPPASGPDSSAVLTMVWSGGNG